VPRVAICAIFKNEAAYLYEWLSFHAFLGVTKFFLYNNNSTDDSVAVIRSWPGPQDVYVIDWPMIPGQNAAYADMIARHRDAADWCAFIDCDEFLCPQTGLSLPETLDLIDPSASGLYVHWRMFGSSGQTEQHAGLVTERFTRRAYDSFGPNNIGKSVVRLGLATTAGFCHIVQTNGRMINDSGDEIDQHGNGIHHRSSHKLLALHHYYTKTMEEWRRRRSMGKADKAPDAADFVRTEKDFHLHDQNVVQDVTALRISQRMKPLFYPHEHAVPSTGPEVPSWI
jgi:hypothetical protein